MHFRGENVNVEIHADLPMKVVVVVVEEDIHLLLAELVEFVTHFNVENVKEVIHVDSAMMILEQQLQQLHHIVVDITLEDPVEDIHLVVHDLEEVFAMPFNVENVKEVIHADSPILPKEEILHTLHHLIDQSPKELILVMLSREVNVLVAIAVAFHMVLMLVLLVVILAVVEAVFAMHFNVVVANVETHVNSLMKLHLLNMLLVIKKIPAKYVNVLHEF